MEKRERIQRIRNLSEKELSVLEFFCVPISYKDISKKLFIQEGTVRTHMRNIYIKLDLFGYHTSIRRFKVIKEFCHLLNDPDYLEEETEGDVDPGKSLIPLEPDKERDELIDEMIEEDEKLWLMGYQQEPIRIIPSKDQVEIIEPRRRIRPRQIIMAVLAFIGFIAIIVTVYEWIRREDEPSIPITQEAPQQQESLEENPTEEAKPPEIAPTYTQSIPTEIPTSEPTTPPKPAILFEDDFESGLSEAWEIVSGNPVVVNGMLTSDQDTWLLVGNPNWKNYTVEFRAKSTVDWSWKGYNAVGVRVNDIDNMYAYKWVRYECGSYIIENGNWSEIPQSDFQVKNDVIKSFRISVENDLITVYLEGEKKSSFFDSRYENGRVALNIFSDTVIDDFKIREIIE